MTDHYQTLGVAKNATPDEIKKAYRRLAAIHHPDKGGDTAEFQKVQAAYETLSDPQKKQEYDNPNPFGQMGGNPFGAGFPGGFSFNVNGFDINDMFGGMFGQRPHHGRPHMPSYRTTVWVTLEQVYTGAEQILQFNTNGINETIKINIPKGVENGQSMRYDNLIKDSILLVEFRVHPHPKFDRNGFDLISTEEVSILDLIVGTVLKITTLGGKELEVTVPPKTNPGAMMRVSGQGLPYQGGFGDQMIVLKPVMPAIIDSRIIDSINQSKGK
jgi:DnaJ-class molecular chaperone